MKILLLNIAVGAGLLLATGVEAAQTTVSATNAPSKPALPRLVDLGACKCAPCRMMVPVLDELKKDYGDQMEVEFIDALKDKDAWKQYNLSAMPTQIFFDATGKELFRHEGFFAKRDILAKWKELGVGLVAPKSRVKSPEAGQKATNS